MPEDRRLTISSSSRLHPDEVARHTFGTTRRGFDPAEVRAFLEQSPVRCRRRPTGSRSSAEPSPRPSTGPPIRSSTRPRSPPPSGQETARVLRSAHDAAAELLARAEADAARLRAQAEEEAEQLQRTPSRAPTTGSPRPRRPPPSSAAGPRRRPTSRLEGPSSRPRSSSPRPAPNAGPWCKRPRSSGPGCSPTSRAAAGSCTARSSSCGPAASGWPRRSATSATPSTASPTSSSGPRTRPGWRPRRPGARRAQDELADEPSTRPQRHRRRRSRSADDIGTGPVGGRAPSRSAVRRRALRPPARRGRHRGGRPGRARSGRPWRPPAHRGASRGRPTPARPSAPAPVAGVEPGDRARPPSAGAPASGRAAMPDADGRRRRRLRPGGRPVEAAADADPRLAQRDEMLTPVVATLARRLKRALQDDQNDILDRLRARGGWAPEVLPHRGRTRRSAMCGRGSSSCWKQPGRAPPSPGANPTTHPASTTSPPSWPRPSWSPCADGSRARARSVDEGDESALVEHVGAAFREWKGARTERLAGDQALAAFSRAALARRARGHRRCDGSSTTTGRECPDCDDNALAGPGSRPARHFPPGIRTRPRTPAAAACLPRRTRRLRPVRTPQDLPRRAAPRRARRGRVVARRRRRRPDRPLRLVADDRHLLHRLPLVRVGAPERRSGATSSPSSRAVLRVRRHLLRRSCG